MSSSDRVTDALEIFFTQLTETIRWREELTREQARADEKKTRILRTLRAGISTLPEADQSPALDRLNRLIGRVESTDTAGSDRTRLIKDWLKFDAPSQFTAAELRDHLARHGHSATMHYTGNLLGRLSKSGEVVRCGKGLYRV